MVGCSKTSSEIKIIKHSFRNVSQIIDSREGQPLKTLRNDCFGIPSEKEIGIVYLLNSQCSICYGECFDLIDLLKKARVKCKVWVIINNNDELLFNAFSEKWSQNTEESNELVVMLSIDSPYPFTEKYLKDHVFIIYDNIIYASIDLEEEILINFF